MDYTTGTLHQSQDESDGFKGQMEARYRERTVLGLVLPDKLSANHQASSEKCSEPTEIQTNESSKKVMDTDFEVSSILAKRPAMKDLITRFESRGSKKSVSQPVYLDQGTTSSVSESFKMKSSKCFSPKVKSPKNVHSLDGLPVRNTNKIQDKTHLNQPLPFLSKRLSVIKPEREKSLDKSSANDTDTSNQTSTGLGDGATKTLDQSDLVVKTTNIRNIAGLKGKPNKDDRYTVHRKEWNKGIESPKLNTVPPAGCASKLSPRTSTPKPDRKKLCKPDRLRIARVKPGDRTRPQSALSRRTDTSSLPTDKAPCTSLSLSSQQENRSRTPTNTQERIFKRSIIKEAKKLKCNEPPTDEKKSTAMERYFKFLKSTTPPPTPSKLGSQSSISVTKNRTTSLSVKIPAVSNSYHTVARWRNSKTTRNKIWSRSQSPAKKDSNIAIKKPAKSPCRSRRQSPVIPSVSCERASPWSATVSPRMTPMKDHSPGVTVKDSPTLDDSPVNQEKQLIPSTYTSSIDVGADKSQETQISVSYKDDRIKKNDISKQPLEEINDTMSDCSISHLDEDLVISTDPTNIQTVEQIEIKRLIKPVQLLDNALTNECVTSTSACNISKERTPEFETKIEENPSVLPSHSDNNIEKKEYRRNEYSLEPEVDSFIPYLRNDAQQKNSIQTSQQNDCDMISHFKTASRQEYLDPNELSRYVYSDAPLLDSNMTLEQNNLSTWKHVSEFNYDSPSVLKASHDIPEPFSVRSLLSKSPVNFVKEKASDFLNNILKSEELHDNDLLPEYMQESSHPKMQLSENSIVTLTDDNDGYLANLKMKALRSLKLFQGNTIENEPENEILDTTDIPQRTASTLSVQYGTSGKPQGNQELYDICNLKAELNMEDLLQGEQSSTSVNSEKKTPDEGDDSLSMHDAHMAVEKTEYMDVIETQTGPTTVTLPSQDTPCALGMNKANINHDDIVIESNIGTGSVAYHFGITNSEIQLGDNEIPLKNPLPKKKKKSDKPEQPDKQDKVEKQKTVKKVKLRKQKSTTDASSEIFVIKKTKKKKKIVSDQQLAKQAQHSHEILLTKPLVNKKKVKKEQEEKSSHDINRSVSQESKERAVKNISPKHSPPYKSPSRLCSSLSSATSLGSLNSIKQFHSPFNSSIVNHPNIRCDVQAINTCLNNIRPVRALSSHPSKNFRIWSQIPVLLPVPCTPRPPLSVDTCHRRWREDYTDEVKPSRIPLSKSFSATLDKAVLSEWTMHSWCQACPVTVDSGGEKSSLWSSVKLDGVISNCPSDRHRNMLRYFISRIIFIIIVGLVIGVTQMFYSLNTVDEDSYSYECINGDEICESKDDISLYVDDL